MTHYHNAEQFLPSQNVMTEAHCKLLETWDRLELSHGVYPVLMTVTGSRAYGTSQPDSDWDFRGVYVDTLSQVLSMDGPSKFFGPDADIDDVMLYELRHFCRLAGAANPTALEVLWGDEFIARRAGHLLRENRSLFLSRKILKTYGGYAAGQMKKAREGTGGSRGQDHHKRLKFKLHTLRLIDAGIHALTFSTVQVKHQRPDLLFEHASRPLDEVEKLVRVGLDIMEVAAEKSKLPDQPDEVAINSLIYRIQTGGY
jgi:predicted nucleotidyltransferase